ncbi:hypothetical protein DB459_01325 [Bradyrhizobium sp. WD16]|nr:hypothetical protein DB459_01325 [Bradyrhizobium sp. WD16]
MAAVLMTPNGSAGRSCNASDGFRKAVNASITTPFAVSPRHPGRNRVCGPRQGRRQRCVGAISDAANVACR